MIKELVARLALVLFIIGVTTEVAHDGGSSGTAKQRSGPGSKDTSASTPGEIAN
jgi:hypothetical protein